MLALAACGGPTEPPAVGPDAGERTSPFAADGSWRDGRPLDALPARNLIVLVVDTWRGDSVGLGGATAGLMPATEALARRGVACRQAIAPAPWTAPSMATLLTGLPPHEHAVVHAEVTPRLAPAIVTYAEVLARAHGYETAAFVDGPWLHGADASLLQGFTVGSSAGVGPDAEGRPGAAQGFWLDGAADIVGPWAASRDRARPFFLLLHTFEAHDPYGPANAPVRTVLPPEAAAERERRVLAFDVGALPTPQEITRVFVLDRIGREALWRTYGARLPGLVTTTLFDGLDGRRDAHVIAEMRTAYQRGLAHVDAGIGRLVPWLQGEGLLENTLLVLVGDHGEAFGEHGPVNHGHTLHEEVVHVPLVLVGPAPFDQPRVLDSPVALADVLPTFFDWAALEAPPRADAMSLLPALAGGAHRGSAPSEMLLTDDMVGPGHRHVAHGARGERYKYVVEHDLDSGEVRELLFDLSEDPGARRNLVAPDGAWPTREWTAGFCAGVEAARDRIDKRVLAGDAFPGAAAFDTPRAPTWTRPAPCGTR